MNTIVIQLFVHPWWVDALIIAGMISIICCILMGLKSLWFCIVNKTMVNAASNYNAKLSSKSNGSHIIADYNQTKWDVNGNEVECVEELDNEMIMGDQLELLTENETDINDGNEFESGKILSSMNPQSIHKLNNTPIVIDDDENDTVQYWPYLDGIEIDEELLHGKKSDESNKASRHKADPSLGGLMNSIDGMMLRLKSVTSLNGIEDGNEDEDADADNDSRNGGHGGARNDDDIDDESDVVTDDSFNENESSIMKMDHNQDLKKQLRLAGASKYILSQLEPSMDRQSRQSFTVSMSLNEYNDNDNENDVIMFGKIDEGCMKDEHEFEDKNNKNKHTRNNQSVDIDAYETDASF